MNRRSRPLAALVALAMLAALSGCGDDDDADDEGSEPTQEASSSVPSADEGELSDETKGALIQLIDPIPSVYIEANIDGAEAAAERLGLTNLQDVNSNGDPAKMVAQINDAITKDAKAIILNPINSEAAGPAIRRANEEGICTIVAYSNVLDTPQNEVAPGSKGFVGWDEEQAGHAVAAALADKLGGKGNVLLVGGLAANLGSQLRVKAAKDEWSSNYPDIKLLGEQNADFDPAKARTVTQNFIQSFGDQINGILYIDDGMGAAGAQVIKDSDLAGDVVIAAFGGNEAFATLIESGDAFATIPFTPYSDYEAAVELAAQCIEGDTTPVVALTPTLPVLEPLESTNYVLTSDNVGEFEPQW